MPATKQCFCQGYNNEFYLLFGFGQSKTQYNAVIKTDTDLGPGT